MSPRLPNADHSVTPWSMVVTGCMLTYHQFFQEFATPPNIHPTSRYIIAHDRFYQLSPALALLANGGVRRPGYYDRFVTELISYVQGPTPEELSQAKGYSATPFDPYHLTEHGWLVSVLECIPKLTVQSKKSVHIFRDLVLPILDKQKGWDRGRWVGAPEGVTVLDEKNLG